MSDFPQRGFTLLEIVIVLLIVGFLLAGVLKGQEMITSAKVKRVAGQLDEIRAAYLGFQDRYKALPGDYRDAPVYIMCPGGTAFTATATAASGITKRPSMAAKYMRISCSGAIFPAPAFSKAITG